MADETEVPRPPSPRSTSELVDWLRSGGRTLVAMSGGVDSGVVAALAGSALGSDAFAVTLGGPAVTEREVRRARQVAKSVGIEHEIVNVDPLTMEGYRQNPTNRCYFCRTGETAALRAWGEAHRITRYVDGVHLDDLGDERPGLLAMDEAGFEHPLVWAGWNKERVRAFALERGLPNWDEPSDACLASRIRHGQPISRELLGRVAAAENRIREFGFRRVRVRVEGDAARVEVDEGEVVRLFSPEVAVPARRALAELGFGEVRFDPLGYRARPGA